MTLWKQALRSIWRNRRAYLACVVLMVVGIGVYVAFHLLYYNTTAAMEGMYASQRFGDAFARVGGIPRGAVGRLENLEGIARAQGSVVADSRVLGMESDKIITLRLASFDPDDTQRLGDFILTAGALPGENEILVGEDFAQAHGLAAGSSLELVLRGQRITPVVAGLVQSPEYVYAIPDAGQLMPDNEAFGFAYMEEERLSLLAGLEGAANSLAFALEEGTPFPQVEPALEEALAPYGLAALYARKDQPSHAMLRQEVDSIGSMSTSVPMMFILIAVVILYIMMRRMIQQERSLIGILKAFGLSDLRVICHYLAYGGILGLVGGVLGLGCGVLMTGALTDVYLEFFSLPSLQVPPDPGVLAAGFFLAVFTGVAGAFMGARSIIRLTPSQAMRPEAPPALKGDLVGRLPFLRAALNSLGFMAVRNITRNRFRSAFVVLGVALSFALTAVMASMGEMIDIMMLDQFQYAELYNLKISLTQPVGYRPALEAAQALPGTRLAEGVLELPAQLRAGHLKEGVPLVGVQADSDLLHIYDSETRAVHPPPKGGLILSATTADSLGVTRGDLLTLTTPQTGDREFSLPVMGTVSSSLGATAYIELESLWQVLGIPPGVSGLLLDSADTAGVKEALLHADKVAAVTDQGQTKAIYDSLLEDYGALLNMMVLAGVVVAFAVITNTAAISLEERKREYATMKVMGMHPREIGQVLGFEFWALTVLAAPIGIWLTGQLKAAMGSMIDSDMFTVPQRTSPGSYLVAALLCGLAVVLSNRSARKKISGFDMVEVLKERE